MKKLSEIDLGELIQDLQNIDINDLKKIGTAPMPVKIAAIVVVCIVVAVAGFFTLNKPQLDSLKVVENKEIELRAEFDKKSSKASNLESYKQQLEEMKRSFGALLRQLPNKTEIETLLVDISQTAIASGLDIEYFKPEGLSPKEFYAEFPIKVRVTGRYHQFARFVSGVAALPRIVTLQNIAIHPPKEKKGVIMEMEMTAVTYQYMDEAELAAAKPKPKGKGKAKPGAKK
ncbi:MAG: type 4a pilus biogenesis protein PilO [Gammaproteobacteria bacterium]|nr:type 4a pilus biogenesis protein PilO [Gammaproteobacteria bacterium]